MRKITHVLQKTQSQFKYMQIVLDYHKHVIINAV